MSFLQRILESAYIRKFITGVILFNAVILGLEASLFMAVKAGSVVEFLDRACLAVFMVELVMKLIAYRLRFFCDGWNIFDFVIIGVSLVPAAQGLSALRSLRILRILRVVSSGSTPAVGCGGLYHGPTGDGLGVFVDDDYFQYWIGDGDQTVWSRFFGMVWDLGPIPYFRL